MCGTPAITTDHAAFSETVRHGVTGFLCHTLEQFVWATRAVGDLAPQTAVRHGECHRGCRRRLEIANLGPRSDRLPLGPGAGGSG
jgi:glycosyltransferase involved in cell wall biosynthesis